MSQEASNDYAKRLEALEDRIRRDPSFSAEDVKLMHEMMASYRGILAWGRVGRAAVITLAAVAGALAAWDVVIAKVRLWLSG